METKNFTILVAEDEPNARFLYEEELRDEGYNVVVAENGLQVLGLLEDRHIDLLMTDIKMPDMHAMEMIPRVRADHPHLPIIVASAFKGMENDFTLKSFHISGFFSKPVPIPALKMLIQEVLRTERSVAGAA